MNQCSRHRKRIDFSGQTLSDQVVVEKVLQGETELFEILMRRYNELLFRTIRSYLDREVDVEDTMQDAYVKAFQKLYQFRNEALFSTWLIRIGINEALQRKRSSKNLRTIDIAQESAVIQIAEISIMNPETKIIHRETAAFIERSIDALPTKYKIVYMLREVEGMEISEISKSLSITNSNVKVRLHRARNMMKDYLVKHTNAQNVFEFGNHKCDRLVEKVMEHISYLHFTK